MNINTFVRAKQIIKIDEAIDNIKEFSKGGGSFGIVYKSYCMNKSDEYVDIPEPLFNVILDAIGMYQEELEEEFKKL